LIQGIIIFPLYIEIKGTNKHYQKRDYEQEKAKDESVKSKGKNFIKIIDKNYDVFVDYLIKSKP
jgi:uncharacterized protein (DUF2235 family)